MALQPTAALGMRWRLPLLAAVIKLWQGCGTVSASEMATPSGSRSGAQMFDVSVLAFPAANSRTLQGLMQLFNLDEPSAQRLIASVPLLLTQQVSAAEAENIAQALRMLGARVVVEPSPRWKAGDFEEDLLPQPRMPVVQNDNDDGLEYDVLGGQETGYAAEAAISVAPSMRSPMDMELAVHEPDRMAEDRGLRRGRQESLDLEQGVVSPGLELASDSKPARPVQAELRETTARAVRTRSEQRAPVAPQPPARTKITTEPAPHGRASVVTHAVASEPESKTTYLLQVLFAFAVAAIGYWADSSVLFGSASLWSVAAHGVALYQLYLGIRGLVT